jgi:hypothetical protein
MSQLFNELMKDDQIKRAVLVKFGFGNVNKSKVTKWVKEQYPVQYAEVKKNIPSKKVVEFSPNETEMTSREERDAFLDKVMGKLDSIQERKTVTVYKDDLDNYISQKELLEVQNEGLTELIYDFIQKNNLSTKFYKFLEEKKKEDRYYCDIEFLMLDYK